MKSFAEFKLSIEQQTQPPSGCSDLLQALWFAQKKDWDRAHQIVQALSNPESAWVHAYLHRLEGDKANADYWYARGGRSRSPIGLEEEWTALVQELL